MQINKLLLIGVLSLSACTKHEYYHGYSFDSKEMVQIKINETSENEVIQLLGSPTTTSLFGDKKYFYIAMHQESEAFFLPYTITQDVLEISFNNSNIVSSTKTYTLNDAKKIEHARNTTKLKGNELTPIEQILSNVGRFNNPKQKSH